MRFCSVCGIPVAYSIRPALGYASLCHPLLVVLACSRAGFPDQFSRFIKALRVYRLPYYFVSYYMYSRKFMVLEVVV